MLASEVPFNDIAILGPGLLGASLALALREKHSVRLWARRAESVQNAQTRGLATLCTSDLSEAVVGADLVIFCTPLEVMAGIARSFAPLLGVQTIVTDVGSVKAPIAMELESIFGADRYLGSHPMAGSEQSGMDAARGDLFQGASCILTPTGQTPQSLVERLQHFWQDLGCEIHFLSAEMHDEQVALVSHLPHLLAGCLMNAVTGKCPESLALAGMGFRDSTRIASGPPEMWQGILTSNRASVLSALSHLQSQLALAERLLAASDDVGLRNFLATAKTNRDGIVRKVRYGGN